MRVIILKTNLKDALSCAERVVGESSNLPVLKNVLLKAADGSLTVVATNLELGVQRRAIAKVLEPGSITIPFTTFYSIITDADSERIHLETSEHTLSVKTDNYQAKIQGLPESEFPIIPKLGELRASLEISTHTLREALSVVVIAAHVSEIRPEISGILFDFQMSALKLVATDSFRLAEKTLHTSEFKATAEAGCRAIVPLKTVQEVTRIFARDQQVSVSFDANQVFFKTEDTELISRLIDGHYPDYEQIIPKKAITEVTLEREHLMSAVRLVGNFAGRANDITLRLKDGTALEAYSSNQHLGENTYLVPAKVNGGAFSDVSFNWRYLSDGLKAIAAKTIILGVSGDAKPAVVRSSEDTSYFYLLMPIKAA